MPVNNRFEHQQYPTVPKVPPTFHHLVQGNVQDYDFSRLHVDVGITDIIVVHGTFMGDDPFAISEMLRSVAGGSSVFGKPFNAVADQLQKRMKPITDNVAADVGNYSDKFLKRFHDLVGGDPRVERLEPTWSGQNHHFARADLAVRLLCRLADLSPATDERILLWGHSHAGNGFALLSNLLANDRVAVGGFFEAAGNPPASHWMRARKILLSVDGPHPLAKSVCIAAFGTPVRYGWDARGYRSLVHVLHHRNADGSKQPDDSDDVDRALTKPLFPPQSPGDVLSAKYGDWVQAFAIAGTDAVPPTAKETDERLTLLLQDSLEKPTHKGAMLLIPTERMRDICARWKAGTRCHTDGLNVLVDYKPCGRTFLGAAVEGAIMGHGVATTVDWLPNHLALVTDALVRVDPHRQ